MKKLNEILTGRIGKVLAALCVIVCIMLFSSIDFRSWGVHGAVITKSSLAFVSLIASFKKKGIELEGDEKAQFEAIDEVLKKGFEGLVSTESLNDELKKIKESMSPEALKKLIEEGTKEMDEEFKKMAATVDGLKTMGGNPGVKYKSLKEQIKEQLSTPEIKAQLKAMQEKTNASGNFSFEVKAAGDMSIGGTTAYTTAGTAIAFPQPDFIPGLNNVARNQPFILQVLNVMSTSKANIVFTEKYNPQGAAAAVGENAAAPEVSFDVRIGNSRAKMVDAFIKVSVQMLDDVDYMASEIEKELIYQVAIAIDTALLQGDGAGNDIAGISSYVGGYTLTSLTTTTPNNCDAVIAAAAQIAHLNFRPDIALMNPIDVTQTTLLKGTTGYYIVNPNNSDEKWGNIRVVESNQVPVGQILVMDSSRTNVYRYMDFTLSYGWVGNDFINNMVTIMGAQRLHSFIKANDVNAFVYDTLANIKTAITAV